MVYGARSPGVELGGADVLRAPVCEVPAPPHPDGTRLVVLGGGTAGTTNTTVCPGPSTRNYSLAPPYCWEGAAAPTTPRNRRASGRHVGGVLTTFEATAYDVRLYEDEAPCDAGTTNCMALR
jgi:hypothetical protein